MSEWGSKEHIDRIIQRSQGFEQRIKQLEEYIEKLENEIKGYIGQHDSTDQ